MRVERVMQCDKTDPAGIRRVTEPRLSFDAALPARMELGDVCSYARTMRYHAELIYG